MIPNSRESLKAYALRKLGHGMNDIEITDEQADDRIDDVVQKFNDFAENGTSRMYYKHQVTADDITNGYLTIPAHITGVIRVLPYGAGGAAQGSPFNVEYQMRLNDMFDLGSTTLLYYTQAMQHLDMLDMLLNGQPQFRFNRVMDRLFIDAKWGPSGKVREGMWIVIECYSAVDPQEFTKFWNEQWVKQYTTALFKQQWGQNLKKFSGVALIGGVQINGQQLWDEAVEEIERLDEELTERWQAPPMFMMG
jgi:hypothetical protein